MFSFPMATSTRVFLSALKNFIEIKSCDSSVLIIFVSTSSGSLIEPEHPNLSENNISPETNIQRVGNMTALIAIFSWVVLGLVTAVSLNPSDCGVDRGLTPTDDVLAGLDTPVFLFRSNKNSKVGHDLILQKDAMTNLVKQSSHFKKSSPGRTKINNECQNSQDWYENLNATLECEAPSTVYPRIVVIVDYGLYQRYNKDLNKLLEYVLAWWNGVDLLFRTLDHPKLRLNIAGIVIEEHADDLPFLAKRKERGNHLPINLLWSWLKSFTKNEGLSWSSHFGNYHIAALMTSIKQCHETKPGVCEYSYAWIGHYSSGQMCKDVNTKGPPHNIFIHDNGNWIRIRRVAHLIESSIQSRPGGGDGYMCLKSPSAVLDYFGDTTANNPDWSPCYLDSFKKRLNGQVAKCFFKRPNVTSPLPRLLLGQVMTGDDQCKHEKGTKYCKQKSICHDLVCEESQTSKRCVRIKRPAADGTICGDGKICYRRQCVDENSVK